MYLWDNIIGILVILTSALFLGTLAERFRQSAVIGYILAGILIGPHGFDLIGSADRVEAIAELGVTLLLFSIGLEFSLSKLIRIGPITFIGGTLQVLITWGIADLIAYLSNFDWRVSLVVGAVITLSSTAFVVRILIDTTQLDSVFGRNAVGILLLQDIAVVPMLLLVSSIGLNSTSNPVGHLIVRKLGAAAVMIVLLYLLFMHIVPRIIQMRSWMRNRELTVLFASVTALGASWLSHEVGLSPSFGAFVSGMLLAECSLSVQIRADISALRVLFLTLFFSSVGMLTDPLWIWNNLSRVALTVPAIVLGKMLIITLIARGFGFRRGVSLATGLCLAQIGEFSFVLIRIAQKNGVLDDDLAMLLMSVTVVLFILTPYLVRMAPHLAHGLQTLRFRQRRQESERNTHHPGRIPDLPRVVIIGFGPSAQRVVSSLVPEHQQNLVVLDSNLRNAQYAESLGVEFHAGDATNPEVLEHLDIRHACAILITIPDPTVNRKIIELCRFLAPESRIMVRARYHIFRESLRDAGADFVVSEEDEVGKSLAEEAHRWLHAWQGGAATP